MTKLEAKQAMIEGKKVTHRYFSDKEWITMEGGKILTEEGYQHEAHEFWHYRQSEYFNDGWELFKPKDLC